MRRTRTNIYLDDRQLSLLRRAGDMRGQLVAEVVEMFIEYSAELVDDIEDEVDETFF